MTRSIAIGKQSFESIIEKNCFYVDKTLFIKEWWESNDDVTLIARPRRFGKTLNMDMLNCFFSNKYSGKDALFEKLDIWEDQRYHEIQGTYPVIFLSFADIKSDNFKDTKNDMVAVINDAYQQHLYLLESNALTEADRELFKKLDEYSKNLDADKEISNEVIFRSIKNLAAILYRKFGKKVIILLDEYDTPMQEAYVNGYWKEMVTLTRSFFNATFKTNPYLERAVMTGITRVSKESVFSDLNNLKVVTVTNDEYSKCFGFTEDEVFAALDEQGLSGEKEKVKAWYDGFTFGERHDIYNPWSIINFLDEKKYKAYWALTSANGLVSKLVQTGSAKIKKTMEELLEGKSIKTELDEQIVFDQLDGSSEALWSLLLASGYLKVDYVDFKNAEGKNIYELSLTNFEVKKMFENMIKVWFKAQGSSSAEFVKALIEGDLEAMNYYMNEIALDTFSNFDVAGRKETRIRPENFYHGFVLVLMVDKRDDYIINSNRESGFGRYDIMMIPRKDILPAIIIEFKVINKIRENSLQETVEAALKQIKERKYDAELLKIGIKKENIRHYGFAFKGKQVLIGEG